MQDWEAQNNARRAAATWARMTASKADPVVERALEKSLLNLLFAYFRVPSAFIGGELSAVCFI